MPIQPKFSSLLILAIVVVGAVSRVATITFNDGLLYCGCPMIFVYLLYYCWIYPFYVSPLSVVPTVPGFPLWGHLYTIITSEVGVPQRKWHEEHGPIVRYFFLLGTERLSVADDEALQRILIKNPYNYPKSPNAKKWMSSILGEGGVLLADGDVHAKQRKALAPAFSISSIKALAPVFWQKGLKLSDLWLQQIQQGNDIGQNFEILEWLNRATMDIIGTAGFGVDFDSLCHPESPLRKAYQSIMAFDLRSRLFHALSTLFPLPHRLNRNVSRARGIVLRTAAEIVSAKHCEAHRNDKDIIALIVTDNSKATETGGDGESQLSFETIRDQVMTFLGAGHDTTATGVAWTLHLLSKHPSIQEKLRTELRERVPCLFNPLARQTPSPNNNSPINIDIDALPCLNDVCRESLRYIPPIPYTCRRLLHDDYLSGYFLPAGTVISIFSNAIHRLSSVWGPTANAFDPDRWTHLPSDMSPNAFLTFLHGPRGCIGRKFAETEMKVLLACLLSRFSFERAEGMGMDGRPLVDQEECKMWRLVLRPRDGLVLRVVLLNEVEGKDGKERRCEKEEEQKEEVHEVQERRGVSIQNMVHKEEKVKGEAR